MKKFLLFGLMFILLCSSTFAITEETLAVFDSDENTVDDRGGLYSVNSTVYLTSIGLGPDSLATNISIYPISTNISIVSVAVVGEIATFPYTEISPTDKYIIVTNNNGGARNVDRTSSGTYGIPNDLGFFVVEGGAYGTPGSYNIISSRYYEIKNFTFSTTLANPVITIEYPINDSTYNYLTFDNSINWTTDLNTNCSLNDTKYVMDFDNGTTFGYINNTPILNGTHIIIINCSTGSAETNTTLTFKIDIASPIIDSSLDLNNTYITINQTFQINYTDDVLLWGFNYSIDGVYQYNITNLTTAFYVYNGSINGSTYSLGQHNLSTTGCDAHTDECIKDFEIIKDKSRIAFDNVDVVSVFSAKRSITEKKIDRYRFGFEYYTPTKEIEIIVPKECTYIDNPHYKGWFVCPGDKKWIDFEGPYDVTVTKDKEFYIVNIKSDKPLTTFMFDSIGELNCNTETYLWFNMGRLNVSSYFYNGSIINNFDVYVNGSLYGSSTTGTINIDNLTEGSYNITVDNPAYELKSQTVLVNESYKAINFSLYTSNSINITILNEDTGNPVTDNITIQFSSLSIGFENITNTSKLYVENLTSGIWAILFTGVDNGYSPKTYYITVGNRSHSSLTAYLSQNYSQTIFTALDKDTSEVLDNVLASMYRSIGGVWTVVESKYTDITGKVQFAYIENVNYQFFFSREDYSDYVFVLTPILFNQYDVKMEKDSRQDQFPDYDRVSILYYPKIFNNNDTTNFTFIIQNPYGELLNYGFNATYPGGTTTQTGINVVGEMFEVVLNITGGVFGDNVDIDFWYNSALTGYKNFTAIYPITFLGSQPTTMMANRDNTYGLGLFERMLFVVIFVIVVVGISTLVGRPIEGMAFGLFLFGVFVYMGFIPLWSVLISIFLGLILLSAKGGR